jgi:hypothetical protein
MNLNIHLKRPQDSKVVRSLRSDSPKTDLQFLIDFLTLDTDQDPCSIGYPKIHQGFVNTILLFSSIELLKDPDRFTELFECTHLTKEAVIASAERFIIASSDHFNKNRVNLSCLFDYKIITTYSEL